MRFKRIYVEITNSCNLACSFCIQNQKENKFMSVEHFTHIAKQICKYTKHVYLHILGEPLLHPKLKDIVDVCAQYGLMVNITTNGTLLKGMLEVLKHASALRQINISLHSFPHHEQVAYIQDIAEAGVVLAALHKHVNLRLWSMHKGELSKETKEVLQEVKEVFHIRFDEDKIQRMERIDIKDHIHLHFEEVFIWPSLQNPFVGIQGKCLGMKQMCGILHNGDIVPCCLDTKGDCTLGNIFTESLKDVLQHKRSQQILQGFSQNSVVEELCQHCSYRLRFSK